MSGAGRGTGVDRLRADDASLAAKSRAAVLGLYSLDLQLDAARRRLATLETEAAQLAAQRASIAHQLRLARLDERISEAQLASRVRFLYIHGNTTTLEVLFGAKSLDDALAQLDDVNRVAAANQNVLIQLHSAQGSLLRLSRTLTARKRALAQTTREAAASAGQLAQTRAVRAGYLAQLTRRRAYDSAQIAKLTAQAQAAEMRSQRLANPPPPARSTAQVTALDVPPAPPAIPAIPGAHTITVVATGYDLSGTTSTGLPVGWGVAAVDPSVIPLGTHLTVPGYGVAIAADTGSSVHGATIDLWFPTLAQAYAWGRRSVTVALN